MAARIRGVPRSATRARVTLTFNSATNGTLIWPGGTVPIQRLPFVQNGFGLAPLANQPENGWWWNEDESGRGFFMEWQGESLDVAGYMYDEQGNSVWYLTVAQMSRPGPAQLRERLVELRERADAHRRVEAQTRTSDHVAPVTITFHGRRHGVDDVAQRTHTDLKRQRF